MPCGVLRQTSATVCFLVDRRQSLLDDLVQAHDNPMTGLMRRARHAADAGQQDRLRTLDLIRRLDRGEIKTLPDDVPTDFVPAGWQKVLHDDRGRLRRSLWETALALAIRDARRFGDRYLPDRRRHAGFWSLVLDERQWATTHDGWYAGHPEGRQRLYPPQ